MIATLRHAPDSEPRNARLGASEVASVLGLGGFHSPLEVWERKRGLVTDSGDTASTRYGRRFEAAIIGWAAEELGARTAIHGAPYTSPFVIGDSPVIGCHPDAYFDLDGAWIPAEVKALNDPEAVGEGADEIATAYYVQVQIQLYCTRAPFGIFAAMVPNRAGRRVTQEIKIRRVEADPDIQAGLVARSEAWWERHIVGNTAPEPGDEDERARLLGYTFPANVRPLRPATTDEAELVRALTHAKAAVKHAAAEEAIAANRVRALIGDAEGVYLSTGKATWKSQDTTRINVEALREAHPDIAARFSVTTSSRVLRVNLKE